MLLSSHEMFIFCRGQQQMVNCDWLATIFIVVHIDANTHSHSEYFNFVTNYYHSVILIFVNKVIKYVLSICLPLDH